MRDAKRRRAGLRPKPRQRNARCRKRRAGDRRRKPCRRPIGCEGRWRRTARKRRQAAPPPQCATTTATAPEPRSADPRLSAWQLACTNRRSAAHARTARCALGAASIATRASRALVLGALPPAGLSAAGALAVAILAVAGGLALAGLAQRRAGAGTADSAGCSASRISPSATTGSPPPSPIRPNMPAGARLGRRAAAFALSRGLSRASPPGAARPIAAAQRRCGAFGFAFAGMLDRRRMAAELGVHRLCLGSAWRDAAGPFDPRAAAMLLPWIGTYAPFRPAGAVPRLRCLRLAAGSGAGSALGAGCVAVARCRDGAGLPRPGAARELCPSPWSSRTSPQEEIDDPRNSRAQFHTARRAELPEHRDVDRRIVLWPESGDARLPARWLSAALLQLQMTTTGRPGTSRASGSAGSIGPDSLLLTGAVDLDIGRMR